ncbi:hypothetical protein BHE90_011691 [Fusarium euwallaceae]|uniref:BTB domain-containing protein n=1 Tax=Fusarium euwallaceae TaxID=1147111 RepID=A0A430LDS4_9HYPO|nr:hypothetical protein BHE90_011691 [Fusarium euwallaceae]
MVKLFLRWPIDPGTCRKAVDIASKNGHYRATRLLFEAHVYPIVNLKGLLLNSIQGGNLPLTEYLLDQGLRYSIDEDLVDLVNWIMDNFEGIQHGYEVLELVLSMGDGILNGKSIESAIKRGLIREVELMVRCPRLQFDDIYADGIWEAALDAKLTRLVGLLAKVKTIPVSESSMQKSGD